MYLINGKALVARSSKKILFFKQKKDRDTGKKHWVQYYHLDSPGFLAYIKGNDRI